MPTSNSFNQALSTPFVLSPPSSPPPIPPHPYQKAGSYDYHSAPSAATSHGQLHHDRHPSEIPSAFSIESEAEKLFHVQNTYVIHHYHHRPLRSSLPPPPHLLRLQAPTSLTPLNTLLRFRFLFVVVAFLPVPPLLSVLYIIIGHSIFRRASSSIQWSAPLLSSANAGATGGAILTLPLALLLFILLSPPSPAASDPAHEAPEDFFDDDDESHVDIAHRMRSYATTIICVSLALGVGGAAGPLGVTCLESGEHSTPTGADGKTAMLTPGRAAEAGVVGGVVMWAAFLTFAFLGGVGWLVWRRWAAVKPHEG